MCSVAWSVYSFYQPADTHTRDLWNNNRAQSTMADAICNHVRLQIIIRLSQFIFYGASDV